MYDACALFRVGALAKRFLLYAVCHKHTYVLGRYTLKFRECIKICTHCIGQVCELFVTYLLLAGTRLAMHTYYKHSAMTNSIQKKPFCQSTDSKKSTRIVHKAKLHSICTKPYHTRPHYTDFKSMPWRSRCGTHKLLASSNKSDRCSLVQEK